MVQAHSGLMSTTGEEGGGPLRVGFSLVDITCGWVAYGGIMTALYQREKTGKGQYVEASLLEGMVSAASYHLVNYLATGNVPGPMGQGHPPLAPYQMFPSQDGQVMPGHRPRSGRQNDTSRCCPPERRQTGLRTTTRRKSEAK